MIRNSLFLALAVTLLGACAEPAGLSRSDSVGLRVTTGGVEIENQRSATIHYFLTDRATAARILWGACKDPTDCPAVPSGVRLSVSRDQIYGWGESDEVILYWWHLVPRGDGRFRVDSIRHVIGTMR
jgi:hypothetical protein